MVKRLLAIDTSSAWCSVAICIASSANERRVLQRHQQLGPAASQHLLPWISELLDEAETSLGDLDAIAIGVGPGAFTGVRLGVAAVQGLAIASHVKIAPVASLDAIAALALEHPLLQTMPAGTHSFMVAIDARMGEVYWASYRLTVGGLNHLNHSLHALPERIGDIKLSPPDQIDFDGIECGFGSAFSEFAQQLSHRLPAAQCDPSLAISALGVLRCGESMLSKQQLISVYDLEPLYIRNKVAQTIAERHAK